MEKTKENTTIREVCSACNGRGYVRERVDWLPALFTFGLSALMQISGRETCRPCNGTGYLLRFRDTR